jgi:hypothetical protein
MGDRHFALLLLPANIDCDWEEAHDLLLLSLFAFNAVMNAQLLKELPSAVSFKVAGYCLTPVATCLLYDGCPTQRLRNDVLGVKPLGIAIVAIDAATNRTEFCISHDKRFQCSPTSSLRRAGNQLMDENPDRAPAQRLVYWLGGRENRWRSAIIAGRRTGAPPPSANCDTVRINAGTGAESLSYWTSFGRRSLTRKSIG